MYNKGKFLCYYSKNQLDGGMNDFNKDIAEQAAINPVWSWGSDYISRLKIESSAGQ